jgi:2'-5' RNA ligase
MPMPERFAIYYAPDSESAFWQRAAAWLGRDAATGVVLPQPVLPGFDGQRFEAFTADPRHYGFHATLKAPFALAETATQADLIAAVAMLASTHPAFNAIIEPQAMGSFIAFRLAAPSTSMQALHESSVRLIDPFRAPLTPADMARRLRAPLTDRQHEQLAAWGYPYVFNDFRFHMTLSGRIENSGDRQQLLDAAIRYFADDCGQHQVTSISLFHQPDAKSPFTILARFTLPQP